VFLVRLNREHDGGWEKKCGGMFNVARWWSGVGPVHGLQGASPQAPDASPKHHRLHLCIAFSGGTLGYLTRCCIAMEALYTEAEDHAFPDYATGTMPQVHVSSEDDKAYARQKRKRTRCALVRTTVLLR